MTPSSHRVLATSLLALACMPAFALYKVIGPDGSVTYTDRAPSTPNAKISTLGRDGQAAATVSVPAAGTAATTGAGAGAGTATNPTDASLPFELRQAATRFPVTLYTTTDCAPCEAGRQLLQQRGVPFKERRVATEEDATALEVAVGGRTLPALTVGAQALRGLSATDWAAYLDAAGYPRESRLPRSWQPAPATAMVDRPAAPRTAVAPPSAPPAAPAPTEPEAAAPVTVAPPTGVRF